jgi:hypothetical protein
MKNIKFTIRYFGLYSLVIGSALLGSGCAPMAKTSKYMAAALSAPASPPAGKTLVCIHRPRTYIGYTLYVGIWDSTNFVADLGNRHSVAYVCEPGQHYFISLFISSSCVKVQLLPDKTYDLWMYSTLELRPVHQDEKMRQRVADWTVNDRWVTPAPTAAGYEQAKRGKARQSLDGFVYGERNNCLLQMAADDHR